MSANQGSNGLMILGCDIDLLFPSGLCVIWSQPDDTLKKAQRKRGFQLEARNTLHVMEEVASCNLPVSPIELRRIDSVEACGITTQPFQA